MYRTWYLNLSLSLWPLAKGYGTPCTARAVLTPGTLNIPLFAAAREQGTHLWKYLRDLTAEWPHERWCDMKSLLRRRRMIIKYIIFEGRNMYQRIKATERRANQNAHKASNPHRQSITNPETKLKRRPQIGQKSHDENAVSAQKNRISVLTMS